MMRIVFLAAVAVVAGLAGGYAAAGSEPPCRRHVPSCGAGKRPLCVCPEARSSSCAWECVASASGPACRP